MKKTEKIKVISYVVLFSVLGFLIGRFTKQPKTETNLIPSYERAMECRGKGGDYYSYELDFSPTSLIIPEESCHLFEKNITL